MTHNLAKLSRTLGNNPALAGIVRSLSVNKCDPDRKVSLLDVCSNLKEYQITDCAQDSHFSNVPKLSCSALCAPRIDVALTELRLQLKKKAAEIIRFEELAKRMIKDKVYINLKAIAFEPVEVKSYGASINLLETSQKILDSNGDSPWFSFFYVFEFSDSVSNLTTLCLQGYARTPRFSMRSIKRAVNLQNLETLEMTINEAGHELDYYKNEGTPDFPLVVTFLLFMAPCIPNVVNLHVSCKSSCNECENKEVAEFIRLLRQNQLTKLSVKLFDPEFHDIMRLHGTIMHSQQNLMSLNYNHNPPLFHDSDNDHFFYERTYRAESHIIDGHESVDNDDWHKRYFSDDYNEADDCDYCDKIDDNDDSYESDEIMNDESDDYELSKHELKVQRISVQHQNYQFIKSQYTPKYLVFGGNLSETREKNEKILAGHLETIKSVFYRDIICMLGKEMMPHLTEYCKQGLCYSVKEDALLLNGNRYDLTGFKTEARQKEMREIFMDSYAKILAEVSFENGRNL